MITPTHNLISNIMAASTSPVPVVGMGATRLMFSDRHAGTIVGVLADLKGKVRGFLWQRDVAKRVDNLGMTDSGQRYDFSLNPHASTVKVTLRKNGRWVIVGESLWTGTAFSVGRRDEFYDFTR